MLTSAFQQTHPIPVGIPIKEAAYPKPFAGGLEYSSPARGSWNIVHIGMLLPEAHQIYMCAAGCLRGVVLTAAEMGAMDRFSSIIVEEKDIYSGKMEDLIFHGICDILSHLPVLPPAVIVFPACVHHFMGCDLKPIYEALRKEYPTVYFIECFMDPIMQKKGMTPDQRLRRELYRVLSPAAHEKMHINIIGNELPLAQDNDLWKLLDENDFTVHDITTCNTFADFLQMSHSAVNIYTQPPAIYAVKDLEKRLGQPYLYVPQSYGYDEIKQLLHGVSDYLHVQRANYGEAVEKCDAALAKAYSIIGDTPIAIDYTATTRPFSLARLLAGHKFNVTSIFTDTVSSDDHDDFTWLQEHCPGLNVYPTMRYEMGVFHKVNAENVLAIGQKCAYFYASPHFVNIINGGGLFGFSGIIRFAELLVDAYKNEKDTKLLVQRKGWGCTSCL